MRRAAALLMPGQRSKEDDKPTQSMCGENDADALLQEEEDTGGGPQQLSTVGTKTRKTLGRKRRTPAPIRVTEVNALAPSTAQQRGGKRSRRVASPTEVRFPRSTVSVKTIFYFFVLHKTIQFFIFRFFSRAKTLGNSRRKGLFFVFLFFFQK